MPLSTNFYRKQLALFKPLLTATSLEHVRRGQEKIGSLMANARRKKVTFEDVNAGGVSAAWITPRDDTRQGVLLYLHGGGFCCGDLEYARGVGAILASECGIKTLSVAYRLAPEHPFPAALEDAMAAYRYLLSCGYSNNDIVLGGECRRRLDLHAVPAASPGGIARSRRSDCHIPLERPERVG